ncbi:NAD(P)-dependent glycerol-1-phosphate dehydrogenase [Methanogenium cariaci]|jgi:glycerol-1-phosphate dehydrogenase [NAD(P)+]
MSPDGIKLLKTPVLDKSKWMQLPRDVIIGHDVLTQLPKVCEDLHVSGSVVVFSGRGTMNVAGNRVLSLINEVADAELFIVDAITPDVITEAEEAGCGADVFVGVGGGRVIDTAKIVSYNCSRPFISIPTAASHDGIASSRASVPVKGGSVSLAASPPIALIADTGIIAAAPHRLLAAGCADVISNYTAILDWELSHRLRGEPLSEYAMALSRMTAEIISKNADLIKPHAEESAWTVIKALLSSGVAMSIAGSSRPASGGEHKFSHALDQIAPGKGLHGEQCGIGSIITMYLHGGDWRGIRNSLRAIGAPTTPKEIGIDDHMAARALILAKSIRPERFTILDMGITEEVAEQLIAMLYEE